jgi:hypothetical protein
MVKKTMTFHREKCIMLNVSFAQKQIASKQQKFGQNYKSSNYRRLTIKT